MSNTNKETDMYCVLNHKVKVRPGTSYTLVEDVLLNCGSYVFVVEDDVRRVQLLNSHHFLGEIIMTTTNGDEIMKEDVDFRKETPFKRDFQILPAVKKDGASNEKEVTNTINIHFSISSTAHIKSIRLRAKILSVIDVKAAQILSSNTETKKLKRNISSSSENFGNNNNKSSPTSSPKSRFKSFSSFDSSSSSSNAALSSRDDNDNDNDDEEDDDDDTTRDDVSDTASVGDKHIDVVEKDILYIEKNTTYSSEGIEQNNNVHITLEHTKTILETSDHSITADNNNNNNNSNSNSSNNNTKPILIERSSAASTSSTSVGGTFSSSSSSLTTGISSTGTSSISGEESLSSSNSQSSYDPSEENLVYYKETKLKKKRVQVETVPIQQRGRYYLVIENMDKGPINRRFSCHLTLSDGSSILKESYTNDAKKKISDDFTVEVETAQLKLELVNTNTSFGSSELQISLYMRNTPLLISGAHLHPSQRTGEVVWSINKSEVEKKHPQKLTANIASSGTYYIVVEKVDKIYGGLREVAVTATLTEPVKDCCGNDKDKKDKKDNKDNTETTQTTQTSLVASVVVGGVKLRPMKWKSPVFIAPAGSTIEFNVESYAIVGSIIYSLRIRKVPGLTAEEERKRRSVVLFLGTFGIYYFLYIAISIMHFLQNIGFTFRFLFLSIDITIGRICFILFVAWCRANQDVLILLMKDVRDTARKIIRKIKYIRDMSDGGKFDILRIFKQMSKEGKANDRRKWERQKLQTANE